MIYDIDITDRIIGGLRQQSTIIQHNVGVDHICPHFDAEWEGFAISAIFKKPAKGKLEELKFSMEAADGGLTVVPWELLDDTRPIQLAFVGIKGDERLVTLFSAATLEVRESGEITGVTPKDPTIDQIEALVAEAQKTVDEAKQSVTDIQGVIDQGKQAVEDAAKAVGDAQTALENAESATEAATASAQAADVAAASANEAAQGATDAAERATKATASANDAAESANAAADRATETDGSVKAAETLRAQAESGRVEAEGARAQAEEQRLASESERVDKEAERQAAEKVRESNETTRTEAETARVSAEEKRAEDHAKHNADQAANNLAQAKNNADQAANNQAAMGLQFKVLKVGEYDPATLEPTVEGATGLFYLVPQEGEENDLYAEWIWVAQNERFERVGNTAMKIEPVTTEQIDSVVNDGTDLQSENTLTATGLAYYDKKRKAANDALYDKAGASAEVDAKLTEYQSAQATKDSEQDQAITAAQSAAEKTAADALAEAVETQAAKDTEQDTAIQAAQARADEAYDHVPDVASVETAGIVKPDGTIITVDGTGLITVKGTVPSAEKLGADTVGSETVPIYLENGTPKVATGVPVKPMTLTLTVTAEGGKEQVIEAAGVLADETLQEIHVMPKASDVELWEKAGLWCVAQEEGTLTFQMKNALEQDVTAYVNIWPLV